MHITQTGCNVNTNKGSKNPRQRRNTPYYISKVLSCILKTCYYLRNLRKWYNFVVVVAVQQHRCPQEQIKAMPYEFPIEDYL